MDHSADGATYKAKVKNLMKNIFVEVIFLIQTGEFVTLSVNVEAGLPVFYEIFWGDGTPNDQYNQTGEYSREQQCLIQNPLFVNA